VSRRRSLLSGGLGVGDGLVLFLTAADNADITQTSGSVTAWNDKSVSSNNATEATNPPTLTTGGIGDKDSITFPNDKSLTLDSTISLTGEYTMFFVNSAVFTGAAIKYLFSSGASAVTNRIGSLNTQKLFIRVLNGGTLDSSLDYPTGNNILTITRDASDKVDAAFNGAAYTRLFSDAAQTGTSVWNAIGTDNEGVNTATWVGELGECLIFDRALNAQERTIVETWLSNLRSISLV